MKPFCLTPGSFCRSQPVASDNPLGQHQAPSSPTPSMSIGPEPLNKYRPAHQETPGAHLLTITSPWLLMSTGVTFSLSPLNSCCPRAGKIKSPQPAGHQTVHLSSLLYSKLPILITLKKILMGIWGPSIQMKFRSKSK